MLHNVFAIPETRTSKEEKEEKEMMDDKRNQMNFDIVSKDCPWRFHGKDFSKCRPTILTIRTKDVAAKLNDCTQKNCPIMHFQKYFASVGLYNK